MTELFSMSREEMLDIIKDQTGEGADKMREMIVNYPKNKVQYVTGELHENSMRIVSPQEAEKIFKELEVKYH